MFALSSVLRAVTRVLLAVLATVAIDAASRAGTAAGSAAAIHAKPAVEARTRARDAEPRPLHTRSLRALLHAQHDLSRAVAMWDDDDDDDDGDDDGSLAPIGGGDLDIDAGGLEDASTPLAGLDLRPAEVIGDAPSYGAAAAGLGPRRGHAARLDPPPRG